MSYRTITMMTRDNDLLDRVTAAVAQEAFNSVTLSLTEFGATSRSSPLAGATYLMWPISADNVAAYESALAGGVPAPGADPSVITDAAILSGVQAHWPPDPAP